MALDSEEDHYLPEEEEEEEEGDKDKGIGM